jgi:hypothetical protein
MNKIWIKENSCVVLLLYFGVRKDQAVYSAWNGILCSLVAVYPCSLLFLVVDAQLTVSRSRVIDEVSNPVHRCAVRRHCSRDGRWKFGF